MSYSTAPRKVTVTTTAGILSNSVRVTGRIFRNLGAVSVFLGGADVTSSGATQGWEVVAGADFPDSMSNGVIYGITASSTADVQIWEVVD